MNKDIPISITAAIILTLLLSACGNTATPSPEPVSTPTDAPMPTVAASPTLDPCAEEYIKAEVDKVHRHMREFDDASTLAASMPREQLGGSIAELQRIRRAAEDEQIPDCLKTLKDHQIQHMNSVISTLIAFMSIADPLALDCTNPNRSAETDAICQNIAFARDEHDRYTLELAEILGIPIVTAQPEQNPSPTPSP